VRAALDQVGLLGKERVAADWSCRSASSSASASRARWSASRRCSSPMSRPAISIPICRWRSCAVPALPGRRRHGDRDARSAHRARVRPARHRARRRPCVHGHSPVIRCRVWWRRDEFRGSRQPSRAGAVRVARAPGARTRSRPLLTLLVIALALAAAGAEGLFVHQCAGGHRQLRPKRGGPVGVFQDRRAASPRRSSWRRRRSSAPTSPAVTGHHRGQGARGVPQVLGLRRRAAGPEGATRCLTRAASSPPTCRGTARPRRSRRCATTSAPGRRWTLVQIDSRVGVALQRDAGGAAPLLDDRRALLGAGVLRSSATPSAWRFRDGARRSR
jgi:hypothetical protein